MLAAFEWHILWQRIFHPDHAFALALWRTVLISVVAQVVGVVLGLVAALMRMSRLWVLRALSNAYTLLFRGTPVIVQIFFVYFGANLLFGFTLIPNTLKLGFFSLDGAVFAGIVALAINEGAYMSEIVRAGILSVDPGQAEAAKSLGMTYGLTMRRIVLPQALRVIVPPLGNEFNNMLKTTSLMSVIAVEELFRVAQAANSATFKSFEAFLGIALYYLALTTIWSILQGAVERRLGEGTAASTDTRVSLRARLLGLARPNSAGLGR